MLPEAMMSEHFYRHWIILVVLERGALELERLGEAWAYCSLSTNTNTIHTSDGLPFADIHPTSFLEACLASYTEACSPCIAEVVCVGDGHRSEVVARSLLFVSAQDTPSKQLEILLIHSFCVASQLIHIYYHYIVFVRLHSHRDQHRAHHRNHHDAMSGGGAHLLHHHTALSQDNFPLVYVRIVKRIERTVY